MASTPPRKSDLPARTASAVVMIAVAGTALWLGGWVWTAFVAAVALGVLWEWWGLTRRFNLRAVWIVAGLIYIGVAAVTLARMRSQVLDGPATMTPILTVIGAVIATDVGAYFAGRSFGGPKIAPKISPSKTWSGLIGGIAGASLLIYLIGLIELNSQSGQEHLKLEGFAGGFIGADWIVSVFDGALIAVTAQAGDFFESWMKRRAGVKDSSTLIPGHGGLFDRVDGLLAVCFAYFVLGLLYFL